MDRDRSAPARGARAAHGDEWWGEIGATTVDAGPSPSATGALIGPLVAVAVASVLAASGHAVAAVGVVLAGTAGSQMTALAWTPWLRALGAVERAVGTTLRALLLGLVFAVVVCPLWLLGRVLRMDPLAMTTRTTGRAAPPARPYARERSTAPARRKLVVAGLVFASIVVNTLLLRAITTDDPAPASVALTSPHALIAHEGQPWAPAMFAEETELANRYDPYLTLRPNDHVGRYINVEDGVRRSYRPSHDAAGDILDVWFFGGSTLFGIGQRDAHTIPSEIVRLAERDGLTVRAWNFGMSSWVNWQETLLFLEELQERPRPDLVVFYDGANDATVYARDGARWPSTYFAPDVERVLGDDGALIARSGSVADARTELERVAEVLHALDAGARTADSAAAPLGVPVRHFLQPVLGTKRPLTTHDEEAYRVVGGVPEHDQSRWDVIRAQPLPDGFIDVSDALDGVDDPVYFDQVHTNELGAAVVAQAMYEHLRPLLERLAALPSG